MCRVKTQASYFPLSSLWLCLFKAPTTTVGVRAQDFRQGPGTSEDQARHLAQGPQSWAEASGLMNQGVQPGQWEALGKSCYCVFGNPVIIVFAVMFLSLLPFLLVNLFPLVSYTERPFKNYIIREAGSWVDSTKNLRS